MFRMVQPGQDIVAGSIVFLVAVPLCLGIALASGAPLFSGVLSGIIGGIIVGLLSGSSTSVSGPAAALAAIVASEIARLGSFSAFQAAVIIGGVIQIVFGFARVGSVAAFFPSSVVKGLLAAIGVLLVLKQIPHLLGHDADPTGEMAFQQPDSANTFSELVRMIDHVHFGAGLIGFGSLTLLVLWELYKPLSLSRIPGPLVAVAFGITMGALLQRLDGTWNIESANFVQVPLTDNFADTLKFLQLPDFTAMSRLTVYKSGFTIALAASLATLLNLESIDKLDRRQRRSPPNRELVAQGIGNLAAGFVGALPMTSEIIRSSVGINAGGGTRLSTLVHGVLLLVSVIIFPHWLNMIPLSCLAAILIVTGVKLASPTLVAQMFRGGRYQFLPFLTTVAAIVFTDLLVGVLVGLVVSAGFILNSNLRRPIRRLVERHLGGDVLRVELANQVSFLNRAALAKVLHDVPSGGHILLDAEDTDYIDPDVLALIRDFCDQGAPARGVKVSLKGFRRKYQLVDQIRYLDYSTRELQDLLSPSQVLQILKDGHRRFQTGERLSRDLTRQVRFTAGKQHPFAVVLSCIDSRAPTELIFDLGLGDVLSIRIAGNVISRKVLASMEYACAVAGAKLIVIMGHTRCGAVTATIEGAAGGAPAADVPSCQHLESIAQEIRASIDTVELPGSHERSEDFVTKVAKANVVRAVEQVLQRSDTLLMLHGSGRIGIVGALYDVSTGDMDFIAHPDSCVP